jgi:hypothetical protein
MNENNEKICQELEALGFHELVDGWVDAMRTGLQLVYDSKKEKTEKMSRAKIYHIGEIVLSNLLNVAIIKNDRPILLYQPDEDGKWTTGHVPLIQAMSKWVPGMPDAKIAYPEMRLQHPEYRLDPMHRIDCGIIFNGSNFVFPIEAKLGETIYSDAEFQKRYLGSGPTLILPDRRKPPLNPPLVTRVNGKVSALLDRMKALSVMCPGHDPMAITKQWAFCLRRKQIESLEKTDWPFHQAKIVFSIEDLAEVYRDDFEEIVNGTFPKIGSAYHELLGPEL